MPAKQMRAVDAYQLVLETAFAKTLRANGLDAETAQDVAKATLQGNAKKAFLANKADPNRIVFLDPEKLSTEPEKDLLTEILALKPSDKPRNPNDDARILDEIINLKPSEPDLNLDYVLPPPGRRMAGLAKDPVTGITSSVDATPQAEHVKAATRAKAMGYPVQTNTGASHKTL